MINQLRFEIYCKPASLFRQEYSELLQGFDNFESNTDAKTSISSLNRQIEQLYYRRQFMSSMKYTSEYDKKQYKQFQGARNVKNHFKNINIFLQKQAENFQIPLKKLHQICFTIALNKTQLNTEESQDIFMQQKLMNLPSVMKQLCIIDEYSPSTNTELFITTGDLCFIFSKVLNDWYTMNQNSNTKTYSTCSHFGDIRLIYKTLLCMNSHQSFFAESKRLGNIDELPDAFFQVGSQFENELLLLTKLGLLGKLYNYSRTVKHKFQCDDDYLMMDSDCHFTRKLPFFCVPTMPANCNLKQLIAMLLSTYKQQQLKRTSQTVLLQTYALVYPAIKSFCNTVIFKQFFKELALLFELDVTAGDLVNEMDLNCYEPLNYIEIKPPNQDLINEYKAAEYEYWYIKTLEDSLIESGVEISKKYKF
jgi:hypothetical protein